MLLLLNNTKVVVAPNERTSSSAAAAAVLFLLPPRFTVAAAAPQADHSEHLGCGGDKRGREGGGSGERSTAFAQAAGCRPATVDRTMFVGVTAASECFDDGTGGGTTVRLAAWHSCGRGAKERLRRARFCALALCVERDKYDCALRRIRWQTEEEEDWRETAGRRRR